MFITKSDLSASGCTADLTLWREGCRKVYLSVMTVQEIEELQTELALMRQEMLKRQAFFRTRKRQLE